MKAKLPLITMALIFLCLLAGISSCRQTDLGEVTTDSTLVLEPNMITLEEGASYQLHLRGVPIGGVVRYRTADPAIATVDVESGLVLAVSQGETDIFAKVSDQEVSCHIVVTMLSEMPLMIFDPKMDGKTLVDERILEHEHLCGRKYTETVPLNTQIYTFPGFYNEKLDVVTAVIYNRRFDEVQEDAIIAYCTEPITNLVRVKEHLAPLGFTHFEPRKFVGSDEVYIYSQSDYNLGLYLHILQTDQIHINALSCIQFIWQRKNAAPCKYHPINPMVKDFPSLDAAAEGKERIKTFEDRLGYRKYDGFDTGYRFVLYDDKVQESNISYVDYQNGSDEMGVSILCRMLAVRNQEDILSQDLKKYLATNGYGLNYQYLFSNSALLSFNDQGDICIVFIEATQGDCWMSIVKKGHHGYSPQALDYIRQHCKAQPEELTRVLTTLR